MKKFKQFITYIPVVIPAKIIRPILILLDNFKSLGDLAVRWWVANIFFQSGLSKITAWTTTVVLFKYDYHVPFLSPEAAAYVGTGAEFLLPILLVLGLGGRIAIFAFFVYNLVCVFSFSFLFTPAGVSGLDDHVNWGLLLALLMFHGSGKYSLDYLIHRKWGYFFKLGEKNQYSWDHSPLDGK
jgi:putative oxidoreductase